MSEKIPKKRRYEDTDDSIVIINEKTFKNASSKNQKSNKKYQIQTNDKQTQDKKQNNQKSKTKLTIPAFYYENIQISNLKKVYLESMQPYQSKKNDINQSDNDLDIVLSTSNTPKRQKSLNLNLNMEIVLSTSNTPKKITNNLSNEQISDQNVFKSDEDNKIKKQHKKKSKSNQQQDKLIQNFQNLNLDQDEEKRETRSSRKSTVKEIEEKVIPQAKSPVKSQSIQKIRKNIKIEDDNQKIPPNQDNNIRQTRYSSFQHQQDDIPKNVKQNLKQVVIKKIEIFTCDDPERRVTRGMIRPPSENREDKQFEQQEQKNQKSIPRKSKAVKKEYFQESDNDLQYDSDQQFEELLKPLSQKIEKKEKKQKIVKTKEQEGSEEEVEDIPKERPVKEKQLRGRSSSKARKASSIEQSFEKEKSKKIIKKTKCSTDSNIQIYMDTIESLQDYSLPTMIPCREKEKKYIKDYLVNALDSNGSGHSLYISGVPGIGKTASLLEIMRVLQSSKKYKNSFTFITTNGMNLQTPENLYSIILKDLTGIQAQKNVACQILQDIFTRGSIPKKYSDCDASKIDKIKVILLDELDYLYTNDQQLLYNLFDWPHYKQSKLIVIGIANTMDFPERLKHKIASRIGNQRLVFNPYNNKQIAEIIQSRLSGLGNVFDNNAVELASKKIAASSSDIRKTLNVCRKAAELCMQEYKEKSQNFLKVGMAHVNKAYYLLYDKTYHKCLPQLSIIHKILLLAISLEVKSRSQGNAYLMDTYDRSRQIYNNFGLSDFPNKSEIESILYQLESIKLISTKDKLWVKKNPKSQIVKNQENNEAKVADIQRTDPHQKSYQNIADLQIILHLQVDDITNALRDDEIFIKFQHMF